MNTLNMQVRRRLIMEQTTYDSNRAVHLARCEVFFDLSVARVQECIKEHAGRRRKAHMDTAIYFLQSALEHATLASKSSRASPQEKAFVRFLQLVLCHLRSAGALLENEEELKDTGSQLWQFLNRKTGAAEARKFTRSSEQLLQDVAHLFDMAHEPLRDLRQAITAQMDAGDTARHGAALAGLREHCAELEHHCRTHSRPNFLFNS